MAPMSRCRSFAKLWALLLAPLFAASCAAANLETYNKAGYAPRGIVPDTEPRWEVIDPFLLVSKWKPANGTATDILVQRYRDYVAQGNAQDNSHGLLPTWWNPGDRDYDPSYLGISSVAVRVWAPAAFRGSCQWKIGGRDLVADCSQAQVVNACTFTAGCEVSIGFGGQPPMIFSIQPRHMIIATAGDSYASGEGVPDIRSSYIPHFATLQNARWTDQRCHRSLFSGHALAALLYTQLNRHVAVSYLSYACSGALLINGFLLPYQGEDPEDPEDPVDPQWYRLARQLRGRQPDFFTVSFGGNDLDFAGIVQDVIGDSDADFVKPLQDKVAQKMFALMPAIHAAGGAEKGAIRARHVIMVGYPNPLELIDHESDETAHLSFEQKAERINKCTGMFPLTVHFVPSGLARVVSVWGGDFTARKIQAIDEHVVAPLRKLSHLLGEALGADPADIIAESFDTTYLHHGFCAPGLNTDETPTRWINILGDSFRTQGTFNISGAMHPNIRGQAAIAKEILKRIVRHECDENLIGPAFLHTEVCSRDGKQGWLSYVGLPDDL
jgi:hypothetical protein